eukprot:TRINITY_DN838_c0_g1_i1.p1 TRINITY_DN838_c0_g1~~TRINITY_DN838_c0_g1_i1.p1  ORF type:complete len:503 (-),score=15.93 TRINITY_DN838_c0_g1_i1:508-2016(-)
MVSTCPNQIKPPVKYIFLIAILETIVKSAVSLVCVFNKERIYIGLMYGRTMSIFDQLYSFRTRADTVFLGGTFFMSVCSLFVIRRTFRDHLRNYKYPRLQMCCMRILLLAPFFAFVSWLMMVFLPRAAFFEVLRDAYETYALYLFWIMLILYCGGQRKVIELLDDEHSTLNNQKGVSHRQRCYLCPLLKPFGLQLPTFAYKGSTSHFSYWRIAVMQWLFVKPGITLAIAILDTLGFDDRLQRMRVVTLIATSVAMHSVFETYVYMYSHLKGLEGSKKFLAIKLLVGVTLGQQLVFNLLVGAGLIREGRFGYTAEDRALRMSATITILQMLAFSIMLSYVFSRRSIQRVGSDAIPGTIEEISKISGGNAPTTPNGVSLWGDWWMQPADEQCNSEKVTLFQVFNMWDTILIWKVEEKPKNSQRSHTKLQQFLQLENSGKQRDKQNTARPQASGDNAKGIDKTPSVRDRVKDFTLPVITQFTTTTSNTLPIPWDQRRNLVSSYLQ